MSKTDDGPHCHRCVPPFQHAAVQSDIAKSCSAKIEERIQLLLFLRDLVPHATMSQKRLLHTLYLGHTCGPSQHHTEL